MLRLPYGKMEVPTLGPLYVAAVISMLPLKRSSVDMTVAVMNCAEAKHSHMTLLHDTKPKFYMHTSAGAPTLIHINIARPYVNLFHHFDFKPIHFNCFHVSHVPRTLIDAQPPHRCSTAMSEFELRRSVENLCTYCITISVHSLFHPGTK